jgi:hypothetical protein
MRHLPLLTLLISAGLLSGCKNDRAAGDDTQGKLAATADASAEPVDDDGPFDPAMGQEIGRLFGQVMMSRPAPLKRAVFLKPHGCAKAEFTIAADLPEAYRVGLFATPGKHDAWVRISSDTVPTTSDLQNNTIGFAVKVLDVPGRKILQGEEQFKTHDFLMQNHHVFFSDTAKDFLEFTRAIFDRTLDDYMTKHPRTKEILGEMAKPVPNVLGTRYWSTTPYRFGDKTYAKYTARPCAPIPEEAASEEPNYLRKRLERDLKANGACYQLQVQLRDPTKDMPLDHATTEWSETVSVPQTVATVTVPAQDILQNDQTCENLSFTAWHALPQHRPVGSVNKARGIVYKQLADIRRQRNGVPISEPGGAE